MNTAQEHRVEVVPGDSSSEDAAATKLRLLRVHGAQQVALAFSGAIEEISVSFVAFLVVFSCQMKQNGQEVLMIESGELEKEMRRLGVGDEIRWEE